MTAATPASPRWHLPAVVAASAGWRFGREIPFGAGTALQWVARRNCSITPRQLVGFYLSLCTVSLAIACGFWWHGAPVIVAFAGVELLLVGVALAVYARHATDREVLTLAGRSLAVEQHLGRRIERADFSADYVAVEPAAGQGSLIEVSAHGRSVRVGRFLRPEMRAPFAQELRRALRRARDLTPNRSDDLQ